MVIVQIITHMTALYTQKYGTVITLHATLIIEVTHWMSCKLPCTYMQYHNKLAMYLSTLKLSQLASWLYWQQSSLKYTQIRTVSQSHAVLLGISILIIM